MKLALILFAAASAQVAVSQDCEGGCQNGGTCFGSTCKCADGYYGKKCHRPCQDIFKSCDRWKEEGRCDWDDQTTYYDEHCPNSCNNCVFVNATIVPYPIAPILEPIEFFIGVWKGVSEGSEHFPVDFLSGGYDEEIRIMATDLPAFDRPCLNYSSLAVSKLDPNDALNENGFIYTLPKKNETLVGIMQTGNSGLTVIQEGFLTGSEIRLTTVYSSSLLQSRIPENANAGASASRIMGVTGDMLYVIVTNPRGSYTKSYKRVRN